MPHEPRARRSPAAFFRTDPDGARAMLAAIVASSDDAIVGKDLNGTITSWNAAAERLFGYSAEEAVGRSIRMLLPPERQHEEDMILATLRRGEPIDHFETVRVRKDGRHVDVSISVSPIRDANGVVIGAAKIARDVMERKRAEVVQARLAALVTSSDDAIVAKDLRGIITDWNPAAERIFGYTAAEMIGRSILTLLPPERHDEETYILSTLVRGERIDHFDTVRVRKDGRRIDVSISVSPIRDATGTVVGAAKIARDVTERKERESERERLLASARAARVEAEAANRAKDEFLSMVSHELRTPLASMLGWIGVLRQGRLSPERTARALETVERNGRLQATLIDDLLDVSRIMSGRLRLDMRPTTLRAIVHAAVEAMRPDAVAAGIDVSAMLDEDPPVNADELRLQQVVSNVLGNAVKFTPAGGRVDVRLDRTDAEARIIVRDTGRGIAKEFLPLVFEPFRQADDVQSRTNGGLGLGLAIVRALVQQHGGSVAVDSAGEGCGTTVTVSLPIVEDVAIAPTGTQ